MNTEEDDFLTEDVTRSIPREYGCFRDDDD